MLAVPLLGAAFFLKVVPVLFIALFIVLLSRSFLRRGSELFFIPPTKFSSYPRCGTGGPVRLDPSVIGGVLRRGRGHVFPLRA